MQIYAWCPELLEAQNGTWTVWLLTGPTFDGFPNTFSVRSHHLALQFLDSNFAICGRRSM